MIEQPSLLDSLFPYFILLAVLVFFWIKRDDGSDIDEGLKDLNKRLDRLEDEFGEDACGHYTSTACHHANEDGNEALHARCRRQCKFCPRLCECECHEDEDPQNFLHLLDDPRDGIPPKKTKWWERF